MMTLYQKFQKLDLDLSGAGLLPADPDTRYFCTPKGAEMIGRAGVDGIHCCFVEGFGDMVFSVSPMNLPGEYVYPIARSFEDFLRLLLACNSFDVLEQARLRSREQFETDLFESGFLEDDTAAAFETLKTELSLTPMPEPFDYIKNLQENFDYAAIPYTEEYQNQNNIWGPENLDLGERRRRPMPKWEVFFDSGYWDDGKREHSGSPGQEIPVNTAFAWGGKRWLIPAVYLCGEGLVIDFCMEAEHENVRAFMDKWNLNRDGGDFSRLSDEERMRMEAENPLRINFNVSAVLNGKNLRQKNGCGVAWIPEDCLPEGEHNDLWAVRVLKHYCLDPSKGWAIHRNALPWVGARETSLQTLQLHLKQSRIAIPGPHFANPKAGDMIPFTHPVSGIKYTVAVREYERAEFDPARFPDAEEMDYPTHYHAMTYTVAPELHWKQFSIQDCVQGDSPRVKNPRPNEFGTVVAGSAAIIGMIRSPDGPAAVSFGGAKPRAACSALHFEPVEQVEWRMIFYEKMMEDIDMEIPVGELYACSRGGLLCT